MSVIPECAAIVFSTRLHSSQTWDGTCLGSRDFAFHGPRGRLYQWTTGASNIGLMSLRAEYLAVQFNTLAGEAFMLPPAGILRPSHSAAARLRQLYRKAFRLTESKPGVVSKVITGLERDLLAALIDCQTSDLVEMII